VMECVAIIQYSIWLNNEPLDSFKSSSSLQQGDPLSPYIFLFVVDGLSQLMQHEVHNGRLHKLHVCRQALGITHLLFVDDTLVFIGAMEEQTRELKDVLQRYDSALGNKSIRPSAQSCLGQTTCRKTWNL
jgi:hypothetical protein